MGPLVKNLRADDRAEIDGDVKRQEQYQKKAGQGHDYLSGNRGFSESAHGELVF
jgi:hypothetical protein